MRRIAVLIGGVAFDTQRKVIWGIRDRAKEAGIDVFVFTCQVNASNGEVKWEGMESIYSLPQLTAFDGVIFSYNTILYENEKIAKKIAEDIRINEIPAVSIDAELPGMANVLMDNYDGVYDMVEHLIIKHGKKEIFFLGGPEGNEDCQERKRAYLDAMEKHGLQVREFQTVEGNFSPKMGQIAWRYWTQECGVIPEAVVCINDTMAVGMKMELQRQGVHVPQDVILTGMDNNWEAVYCAPRLTSIERSCYEAGYCACQLLENGKTAKELSEISKIMKAKLVLSESCGCNEIEAINLAELKMDLVDRKIKNQFLMDNLKGLIQDFSCADDFEEFKETLKRYVDITDAQYFYLCINQFDAMFGVDESVDGREKVEKYREKMWIPLAYENGKFGEYGVFESKDVIPPECNQTEGGNFYFCMPLGYENQNFGYCVFGNTDFPMEEYLCYTWVLTIGGAIQNIRRKLQLNTTIDKLNKMWIYDSLTGLYNRAGFFHLASPLLKKLKQQKLDIFVIFMDLDGLKKVNDSYGHEIGDRYICSMADIVKEVIREPELAMRYGGDEYVILGPMVEKKRVEELVKHIETKVADTNQQQEQEYKLAVSIGYQILHPREENCKLEQIIEQADREMYKQKKKKNKQKNKSFSGEAYIRKIESRVVSGEADGMDERCYR